MGVFGAGVGAGLGAVLGGPLGALIGAWAGHKLTSPSDESDREASRQSHAPELSEGERQAVFFVAMFSMLAKMAKADGSVCRKEADVINRFARETLELDSDDRKAAGDIFRRAIDDGFSIEDYARQIRSVFSDAEMRTVVYRALFEVAMADEHIHAAERNILERLPELLGLDATMFRTLWEEHVGAPLAVEEHYRLLGVSRDASDVEIRRAYLRLSKEYHPDRLAGKGLPEPFYAFALEQMQQINAAYDAIKKERSIQT